MHSIQRFSGMIGIILIAIIGSIAAPSASPARDLGHDAYAQEQKSPTTKQIYIWTRARIAAANKRWAQDKEKFAYCSEQLKQEQSIRQKQNKRRLMTHGQADFMQDCMNRNP